MSTLTLTIPVGRPIDGHHAWCGYHGDLACTCGKTQDDEITRLKAEVETYKQQTIDLRWEAEFVADRKRNELLFDEIRRLRADLESMTQHAQELEAVNRNLQREYEIRDRACREALKRLEEIEKELDLYRAEDTCMCGAPMSGHTWVDGHAPVSMTSYGVAFGLNTGKRKKGNPVIGDDMYE